MANSFNFDSYDFSALNMLLLPDTLDFGVAAEANSTRIARGDGAVAPPSTYGPKPISFSCILTAASVAARLTALDTLMLKLQEVEDAALLLDHIPLRYWMARLQGAPQVTPLGSVGAKVDLAFLCNDPFAFATVATVVSDTIASTMTSSDTTTFVAGGSVYAAPVITVVLSATSDRFMVGNEDNEEELFWESPGSGFDLAIGDTVKLECSPFIQLFSIKRSGDAAYIPLMNGVSGRFPKINAGVSNTITWRGLTGAATITYRNRFI